MSLNDAFCAASLAVVFHRPRRMDFFFKNRYYRVNRLSLIILGLWPYHNRITRVIKAIFMFIIFAITLVSMMIKVVRTESSVDFITYTLQFAVPSTIFFLDLCYFFCNLAKMQALLEHIKRDWDLLQSVEFKFMEKYAEESSLYTNIFTAMAVAVPFIHVIGIEFIDLEEVSDSNGTAEFMLPFPMEYGIDHRKYFNYIMFHIFLHILAGLLLAISIGTMYLAQVYHACAMFKIVGHRLTTMFDEFEEELFVREHNENVLRETFRILALHSRIIQFTSAVNSLYAPIYIVEVGLQIILLSSDILRLIHALVILNDFGMALTCIVHIMSVLLTTCMFAYTGQKLIDHSTLVQNNVYESRWYIAPLRMRKLLLIVMLRSSKECTITVTRSITVSYELLASILQMSMSYFMSLYSLR